ncbi:MAG: GNAT family N-acetyltransferase [Flavobacterium sp.]|uniref:GNAT family N-acetyltransferase n=1 Tax=unclassified Flavobacterium TaxID=196869 RepID=UPI000C3E075E|nr:MULTISPECIES: GNAT family protein [unclassified Flavobacterium]MBF02178.1 GNAT family N-acetyltransferase [Flavobacterium sp.]MBF03839.1 GNAT family N-acetyltransferase [Flavobacterium sp.]MCO6164202.1 GNAT family N-acetyltransferase [Flavobacterium sp. NRK F7]|tara:strand:+ start:2301 stop:2891 length:591 start_codon:yes stop_codon:yes gene_type:complete
MKNQYKSERLYLKEIEIHNINDTVMAWFDDEELMRFYSNSKNKITKERLLQSIEEGKQKGNLFTFGIFVHENNELIGTLKLGPINFVHKTSDLVALIGNRNFLGKGLAVEAIKLGNELAFHEFDIRKLYGGMYVSNVASIKAYHRAGWIIEGRLKGFYMVDGKNEDRILVGCYNPKYFTEVEIKELKDNENRYFSY